MRKAVLPYPLLCSNNNTCTNTTPARCLLLCTLVARSDSSSRPEMEGQGGKLRSAHPPTQRFGGAAGTLYRGGRIDSGGIPRLWRAFLPVQTACKQPHFPLSGCLVSGGYRRCSSTNVCIAWMYRVIVSYQVIHPCDTDSRYRKSVFEDKSCSFWIVAQKECVCPCW